MQPYYQDDYVTIYNGDCREILPDLSDKSVDLLLTDPPYGCKNNCDYTRFSGGLNQSRNNFNGRNRDSTEYVGIIGDDDEFDPTPFLNYPNVVIWGYQFFATKVPLGTVLVWNKKRESQLGTFLSDCELAWQRGGYGVYLFNHIWHGMDRQSEQGLKTLHPTQKPLALMRWCLQRFNNLNLVLDPYCGSGTTLRAAKELGIKSIGIEIKEEYCEIAARRCMQTVMNFKNLQQNKNKTEQGILI